MKITRKSKIELTKDEMFLTTVMFCRDNPEAAEKILSTIKSGQIVSCPFPFQCNCFPCEDLICNADCCSNGFAYRMS